MARWVSANADSREAAERKLKDQELVGRLRIVTVMEAVRPETGWVAMGWVEIDG